jgi:hypothetical protein
MLFLDFKQAVDSVNHRALYGALLNFGIPVKLINLIQMTMSQTIGKVLVGNQTSRVIQVRSGVRRRCTVCCSPQFGATKCNSEGGTKWHSSKQDNTDIWICRRYCPYGTKSHSPQRIFNELAKEAKILGLKINENKTKYLIISNLQGR